MYKNVNEAVKNPTILANIVGVCSPAMILPVAVIGVFGFALYKALGFKKENQRLEIANKALKTQVEQSEYDYYDDKERCYEQLGNSTITVEPTVGSTIEDEKELLRKTMSILGKRSAEKRRARKREGEGL